MTGFHPRSFAPLGALLILCSGAELGCNDEAPEGCGEGALLMDGKCVVDGASAGDGESGDGDSGGDGDSDTVGAGGRGSGGDGEADSDGGSDGDGDGDGDGEVGSAGASGDGDVEGVLCEGSEPPPECMLEIPEGCGDAAVDPVGETCDDGNTEGEDGCSSSCTIEPGYECATAGQPCASIMSCGDDQVGAEEACDDGNQANGDGCSSTCQREDGFACSQAPSCQGELCVLTLPVIYRDFSVSHPDFGVECGTIERGIPNTQLTADGKPELSAASFEDACIESATSYAEWFRDTPSNVELNDSLVLYANGAGGYVNRFGENGEPYVTIIDTGAEEGGYGTDAASCASACTERMTNALQCPNVCRPEHNALAVELDELDELTTRVEEGPDQLAQLNLDLEEAQTETAPDQDLIAALQAEVAALEQSITDASLAIPETEALIADLELAAAQCDLDCEARLPERIASCQEACLPCSFAPYLWCIGGERVELDGNPLFFPIEESLGSTHDLALATVAQEYYYGAWTEDPSGELRNFYFTTEVSFWFEYTDGMTAELSILGDDDLWVFVNGSLAVDVGGLHVPTEGGFTINSDGTVDQLHGRSGTGNESEANSLFVEDFGLVSGNLYEVKVFQAERKMSGSSFKLHLSGFDSGSSLCVSK